MKKLIILLTLVAVSFSADKWEYAVGVHLTIETVNEKKDEWMVLGDETKKYNISTKEMKKMSKANAFLFGMNKMGADGWEFMFKEPQSESSSDANAADILGYVSMSSQPVIKYFYFKRKIN